MSRSLESAPRDPEARPEDLPAAFFRVPVAGPRSGSPSGPTAATRTPAPATPAAPEVDVLVEEETEERLDAPWRVILFNDDVHTFEEVIMQLIKATGCTTAQAEAYAWQVHTQGKAAVYEGAFEACFRVQSILREIQLVTEIEG